ncbi:MAG: type II toxin-antitoxin system HicB family antitoxin [Synergistaceae bacterium]|nr:type II toxin-antitoxin system HicB family antitoxin [Synergistaceae bacterium]
MKYVYPAIFEYDPVEKGWNVSFPDIRGCLTCGWNRHEALYMAEDALNAMLWTMEYDGDEIPPASNMYDIPRPEHGFVQYVPADTEVYTAVIRRENPGMEIDESRIKKGLAPAV